MKDLDKCVKSKSCENVIVYANATSFPFSVAMVFVWHGLCGPWFSFSFVFVVVGVLSLVGMGVVHLCVQKVEQEHELAFRTSEGLSERSGCLCGGYCSVLHNFGVHP